MIRSMTGYGASERELPDGRTLRIEIKSVNHRHLNPNIRLPQSWDALESVVAEALRGSLARGRVSVTISCERSGEGGSGLPELDLARARHYVSLLQAAGTELGLTGAPGVDTLLRLPDLFTVERGDAEVPDLAGLVEGLEEALAQLLEMRAAEGKRLEQDMRRGLQHMGEELRKVEARAPERLVRERDRLREQVRALSEAVEVDEDRLAREIAYLAEKWDLNEEVVRLRSHMEMFGETLDRGGSSPAGKRLGFVTQEMNREANTIAAKANDAEIAAAAVAIKEELERLREQLENVE